MTATSYHPARWLPDPHSMTMYGRIFRRPPRQPIRRERWELADGDFLDLDFLAGPSPDAPILIVLHGLEGSSRASYVRGLMATARAAGLASCALNFRGCSGEVNRLPRFYHSGETSDLAALVDRLVGEQPGRPIGLVGFSLGGNVVAKYLGERGDDVPFEVRAAAVISVPFDLAACAHALDGPGVQARIYRGLFIRSLKMKAAAKAKRFPDAVDGARAARARTFTEIDGWFTAPLHGFPSAEDYWARCSSGPLLGGVRRPLLALSAHDDPFVPGESLPVAIAQQNPLVTLEVTAKGGHQGFIAGPPWAPERWAEREAVAYLRERL